VITRALVDHYRCPAEFVKMSLVGELSADSGYFRFGPNICYGQSSSGSRSRVIADGLHDTGSAVIAAGDHLGIPFDPSKVVDNLRWERYAADSGMEHVLRLELRQRFYYSFRRFMPVALRRALQRAYFRDWKSLPFPRWPVDDTVDQLMERLLFLCLQSQGVARVPFVWFWPDGAPSCAIVTHDVETSVGRDRCSWLMDVDESHAIKASFQIVPEERYAVSPAFLDGIRARGFEINVHDLNHDGLLFSDRREFQRRAQRINHYAREFGARGFRSGALYRRADWYDALDVAYDMSIPNAGHLEAQRGGCCTVMPYFIGEIVELPLTTTQDYSLFRILRDFSNDTWKNQLKLVVDRHGLASFIVHPDYLDTDPARKAYGALLDRLSGLREAGRCWVPLPGEVERWWRERSQMTLVRDGGGWRIEGAGKERARIAYAELAGGSLIYSLESPATNREPISESERSGMGTWRGHSGMGGATGVPRSLRSGKESVTVEPATAWKRWLARGGADM
jgi:hypothetical protein